MLRLATAIASANCSSVASRSEATLEFAASVDHYLGHRRFRLAGLLVDHPGASAVARQIQPVDVSLDENAGAGDLDLLGRIPGQVIT